jgi:hypothetical protein
VAHGEDAKMLADGQSLMPMLSLWLARPAVLIDLSPQARARALRSRTRASRCGCPRSRGIGEPPVGPCAATIASGIADAVGVRLTELPMTPDRVLAALDAQDPPGTEGVSRA